MINPFFFKSNPATKRVLQQQENARQVDSAIAKMLNGTLSEENRRLLLCLQGRFDEVERMNAAKGVAQGAATRVLPEQGGNE